MKKVMLVTTNLIRRLYENLESEQKPSNPIYSLERICIL